MQTFLPRRRPAFAVAVALFACACSSSSSNRVNGSTGDGGTTVGTECDTLGATFCMHESQCVTKGADGGSVTAAAQCAAIGQAFCQRQTTQCQTPATLAACEQQFTQGCCATPGTCADAVVSTQANVQACMQTIGQAACVDIQNGNLPTACQGVVQAWTTVATCETQFHAACCAGNSTCSLISTGPQASIDSCNQALGALACGAAAPSACVGVIKATSVPGIEPVVVSDALSAGETARRLTSVVGSLVTR